MEDYNKLLDRFDNVLKENESLKDEIKVLKDDTTFEGINKRINKFNTYYVSQIKAIRTIAKEVHLDEYDLNQARQNILSICDDTAIDFDNVDNINIDECANKVIELVNKYHYLVDDNGIGRDNDYFINDVKRIITKHINLTNKGGE